MDDLHGQGKPQDEDMKALAPMMDTPVTPAMGVAAIALNMAMKYHDFTIVKDGALYQQYKLEGRNMQPMHLDTVFETAIHIEMHLLTREKMIAKMIGDAVFDGLQAAIAEEEQEEPSEAGDSREEGRRG